MLCIFNLQGMLCNLQEKKMKIKKIENERAMTVLSPLVFQWPLYIIL